MTRPIEQRYENHARIHPIFHFVSAPLSLLISLGSLILLANSLVQGRISWSDLFFFLTAILLVILTLLVRTYALKVQDRAIRAETQLRHYILTGKALDSRLTIKQIVALRFAGDEEFPELCSKAANQGMEPDDIKKAVQNWQPDHYRI